jgi:hypothetical protein
MKLHLPMTMMVRVGMMVLAATMLIMMGMMVS